MEETVNTDEYAIIAMLSMLLFAIIGGIISYKLISSKEKERAKECAMNRETKWCSRMKWYQKAVSGYNIIIFISVPMVLSLIFSLPSQHKIPLNIEILICSVVILLSIVGIWLLASRYPLFAITNDSVILWRYWGYARSEQYQLSELTRKEYEETTRAGTCTSVDLYRGDKRIQKLVSNTYKDEKTFLELLRQIPEKEK